MRPGIERVPYPAEDDSPTPPPGSGAWVEVRAWLFVGVGAAAAGAVVYLRMPGWAWAAPALGWAWALRGRSVRMAVARSLRWALPRWLAWVAAAAAACTWRVGIWAGAVVTVCGLGVWALRRPSRERLDPNTGVKSDAIDDYAASIGEAWETAARRAGLAHPARADEVAPVLDGPRPNGAGGVQLDVGLAEVVSVPEHLQAATGSLGVDLQGWALVEARPEEWGRRRARLHVYERPPLTACVPWQMLGDLQVGGGVGEWAPFGLTAFGLAAPAASVPVRYVTLHSGATGAGKTTGLLATVAGGCAADIPLQVSAIEAKGFRGASELLPLAETCIGYASRVADTWHAVRPVLAEMDRRQAAIGSIAEMRLTAETPAVWLLIPELLPVLDGRTPTPPPDGMGWEEWLLGRWTPKAGARAGTRPTADEWQGIVLKALIQIASSGRNVGVGGQWATHVAQVEQIRSELRNVIPSRICYRIPDRSSVTPALGVSPEVAPAHQISPRHQGQCYVRWGQEGAVLARAAYVGADDVDEALIRPLGRWRRASSGAHLRAV